MTRFYEISQDPSRVGSLCEAEYILVFDAVLEKILVMIKGMEINPEDYDLVKAFVDMATSEAENGKQLEQLVEEYKHFLKAE